MRSIIARCGVGVAVPRETFARHSRSIAGGGLVDGEMQGYDGVTAIGSGEALVVVAVGSVGLAVPFVAVASGYGQILVIGGADRERHRHHGVAAVGGGQCDDCVSSSGESNAVPQVWQCARTNGLGIAHCVTWTDSEMQGYDRVTTVGGNEALVVIAGGGVGLAVPFITVASGFRDFCGYCMVHRQMQGHDRIATSGIGSI